MSLNTGSSLLNLLIVLVIIIIFLVVIFWILDRFLVMDGGILLVYASTDEKEELEDNQDKLTEALKDYCKHLEVEFDNDTEVVLCQLKNDTNNNNN